MGKRKATTWKQPSLKFRRYRAKFQNLQNRSFLVQFFDSHVVAKENCVQNLVFLRVHTVRKIESYGVNVDRRPKTDFCVREYDTNWSRELAPSAVWGPKMKPKHETFYRCMFPCDREYETNPIVLARYASTASRSHFRGQRVRDKLETQASQERRVRHKSTHGLSAPRPGPSRHPSFLQKGSQDSFYL